jgi:hypothetical protein
MELSAVLSSVVLQTRDDRAQHPNPRRIST